MLFEPGCKFGFRESARGKGNHHRVRILLVGDYFPAVLLEKKIHQDKGNSLVTINEGMVPAQMKPVCRGFLEECPVCKLATDRDFRLRQSGLEKASISEAGQTSVTLKKIGVNDKDKIIGNEVNSHYLARALSTFLYLRFVRS